MFGYLYGTVVVRVKGQAVGLLDGRANPVRSLRASEGGDITRSGTNPPVTKASCRLRP